MKIKSIFTIIVLVFLTISSQASSRPSGNIYGYVTDVETKSPLQYVNIIIHKLQTGTITDSVGKFELNQIPAGSYSVEFRMMGYHAVIKSDVIVRSGSDTYISQGLGKKSVQISGIIVQDKNYFSIPSKQANSAVGFSNEEIRRSPGAGGDISRIVMNLPSVAKIDNQKNNLIVRGGSPTENAFFIDNIEIPNINHFPTQGASGGAIGLVNVDFIEHVNFLTGGFSAKYGNRLSSIMDIKFREGNRRRFDGQLDLNFAGFGGILEGPLTDQNGSYLFSIRRSYLDFLIDTIDLGTSLAPSYGDYQGKMVYNLDSNNKFSFLAIGSDDHSNSTAEIAEENDMVYYGDQDIFQNTAGMNWKHLWNSKGYSNTSLAYTQEDYDETWFEAGTNKFLGENFSRNGNLKVRNVNFHRFTDNFSAEFGFDTSYRIIDYDNYKAESVNSYGDTIPANTYDKIEESYNYGGFVNLKFRLSPRLKTTLGIRGDLYSYSKNFLFSPRFSSTYNLTRLTTLKGAVGVYYQNYPAIFISQNEEVKNLKTPKAVHYILGLEHLLTQDTKLSLEIYNKNYDNFPLDPSTPGVFVIDEILNNYANFQHHENLTDRGIATAKGIELILQKKLATDLYGVISGSYFSAEYKDYHGNWHDRVFDNRILFSVQGGYKPNDKWEFSSRWIYAGGRPYTPYDIQASKAANHGIIDSSRINAKRYHDYHSLNLRVDRRFHFANSNLVVYLSIWNAYDHKNIASYYWNKAKNERGKIYQWGLMPIFGVEYEF